MKPYNTIEDVSINEKSPLEAMALLPIWLITMLKILWEKKWEAKSEWYINIILSPQAVRHGVRILCIILQGPDY